jgi:hypothetical protein
MKESQRESEIERKLDEVIEMQQTLQLILNETKLRV